MLALALPPLLLLAAESRRLSPSIPRGSWLPPETESALAERDLAAMGRRGVLHALRAVVFLPEDVQALSREGWEASRRLAEGSPRTRASPPSGRLRSQLAERATGETKDELAAAALAPAMAKRTFLAEEGDAFLLEILPREELDGRQQIALVRDLRRARRLARGRPRGRCGSRSGACPLSTPTTKRPWPDASRA